MMEQQRQSHFPKMRANSQFSWNSEAASRINTKTVSVITCKAFCFDWQTFPSLCLDLQFTISPFFSFSTSGYPTPRTSLDAWESEGKVSIQPQCPCLGGTVLLPLRTEVFPLSTSAAWAPPPSLLLLHYFLSFCKVTQGATFHCPRLELSLQFILSFPL